MKVGDKVYITERAAAGVTKGVVVAKKWTFDPMPHSWYVVRKVKEVTGVVDLISSAFYGSTTDLDFYPASALTKVPDIASETTADSKPENQALTEGPKSE